MGGSRPEKIARARDYIEEAISRDPRNGDAQAALGYILWAEGDFEESILAYDKADRFGADVGWGSAIPLRSLGRFAEAVEVYRRAEPQYPISLLLKGQLVDTMYCAGQYAAITADEDELIEFWPAELVGLRHIIARAHARLGNGDRALAYMDELVPKHRAETDFAITLALIGEEERARKAIDELTDLGRGLVNAATAALILGEHNNNPLRDDQRAPSEALFR